jgi:hypothetical protein
MKPERLVALLRAAAGALSVLLIALTAWTTLSRIGFPWELEWLEGWTVVSVQRLLDGRGLFVAPSLEFVPYCYTPLYTYLSAALSAIMGVGFLAPRIVSLAAAAGCLWAAWRLVRIESGSTLCGLAAAGFLAGSYPLSGAWFDIARVDTLFLFFVLAAFLVLRRSSSPRAAAWAGTLMGLAYLTKQTALLPLAALCLYALFELRGWSRLALPGTAGAIIGLTTLGFSLASDGWYFYYTVIVPGLHGFGREEMLGDFWTKDLGWAMLPSALLGLLFLGSLLARGPDGRERFVFWSTATIAMLGAAWTSRLHGGGWINVIQPAHAMLALLFGMGLHEARRRRPPAAALIAALAALQLGLLVYSPSLLVPGRREVDDGAAFVSALSVIDGEVYTPMHGWLPTLAGKREHAHDGYLLTILRTGDMEVVGPLERGVREAFARRRFAAVVIDFDDYRYLGPLREGYRLAGELPGSFRPRKGPRSAPQMLWVRKQAEPGS